MSKRQSPGGAGWAPTIGWRLFQLLTVAGLILVGWRLLGNVPYRIDIDVYRMGGRAWLDNQPLYADGAIFHTQGGLDLPFTYPPLAAIMFAPFAWLSLPAASVAITVTTLVLLIVSIVIVLTRLNVWPEHHDHLGARLAASLLAGNRAWWCRRSSGWSRSGRTSSSARSTWC